MRTKKAADRDRSLAWWQQRLALGICAACREDLPEDFRPATPIHLVCARLSSRGYTYAEIRTMTQAERERKGALR